MPKSVHITTPWPTSEEVAKRSRISKRRQKELEAIVQGFFKRSHAGEKRTKGKVAEREENRKDAPAAD